MISLDNLQTILGIILLSVQIVLIVVKLSISIYRKLKSGKVEEIEKDIEDAQSKLESLTEKEKHE